MFSKFSHALTQMSKIASLLIPEPTADLPQVWKHQKYEVNRGLHSSIN